jgi:chitosanase
MDNQPIPAEALQRLMEAAQAINAVASRLGQVTASPGFRAAPAAPAAVDGASGLASGLAPGMMADGTAALALTPAQRAVCERVINVFETGTVRGKYGAIAIFDDGPNDIRQITYGRSQTTEYGNLRELVDRYVTAGGGFADQLRPFVPLIGRTALVDDQTFKDLLRRAGNEDPVMERVQDEFFAIRYFDPAMRWAARNGFMRALSALVIYDSFIHSGSILDFLRARFQEVPPARGGNEQTWIRQYVEVRHDWLSNHPKPVIRASAYRTRDLLREVAAGNWDLAVLPIMANGTPVDAGGLGAVAATGMAPAMDRDDIPYLGNGHATAAPRTNGYGGEVWCESEGMPAVTGPQAGMAAAFAAAGSAAALAQNILQNPRISLATGHVSGVQDQATAKHNIHDTAAGGQAQRSAYGIAPGGSVPLDIRMLGGVLSLAQDYSFSVSEFVGGSHSVNSRHYAGITADFNIINGRQVSASHPDITGFMARCRDLGATEVLGPGFPGHDTHIHAAWPRPA